MADVPTPRRPADHGPETPEPTLRVRPAPQVAGGFGAMASTLKQLGSVGVLRGAGLLFGRGAVNQADGFDCPGCAWPDPEHRSIAEFCENGAKAVAEEATPARIGRDFFARWSIPDLLAQTDHWLGKQGRLTEPMIRRAGSDHYEPIAWGDALRRVGARLRALDDPDEAAFYTSGRASNEAAFLYQLFVRRLGTNNLPDCSNLCHESSGVGLVETLGVGKGTVQLEDFALADAIFVVGQNPGTNHPRMLVALQEAARRGARIVSINPLNEAGLNRFKHPKEVSRLAGRGTSLASLHLPVTVGGDVHAFTGILKHLLEAEAAAPGTVVDRAFIDAYTDGFEALEAQVSAIPWQTIEAGSGLTRDALGEAAAVWRGAPRVIVCWAMGLTQHRHGVANVQMAVNLLLLGGHVGRPGAGACPVRGHSNVQGDRTMGIWERPPQAFLDQLQARFGFEPPRRHGYDVVATINAMRANQIRVFMALGGNFYSASPDSDATAAGLSACDLTVQVSTKLNRSHLITGREALILPCLGRTERDLRGGVPQWVTVENSMGVVHRSEGRRPPASEGLQGEPAIIGALGEAAFGSDDLVPWARFGADYGQIRAAIGDVLPDFRDLDARLAAQGRVVLPNAARERRFETATGKARFTTHDLPELPLADDELVMMTLRSHDQYNTTIYGLDDRYRGITGGRRVVLMHPEDIAARGLAAGDRVDLSSTDAGQVRHARGFTVVAFEIPRRCAGTYFPEANPLIPLSAVAARSGTPASKSVAIRVVAAAS